MASAIAGSSEQEDEIDSKGEQDDDSEVEVCSEDEDTLKNQKVSTLSDGYSALTKYSASLFLKLAGYTEEFYMDRNIECIGMFGDIVYQYKDQNSGSYNTYYIKFVSAEHYALNLFEAYFSYNAVNHRARCEFLNANSSQNFALIIANELGLESFNLRTYINKFADSFGMMSFSAKFVSTLIKDTVVLKTYRLSLYNAKQSLVSNEVAMATDELDKLRRKLKTEHLKEILSPEYYKDHGQFITFLENVITALEGEVDWKNFCTSFKICTVVHMHPSTHITLLRRQLWCMCDFPIMTIDTIISKLLNIFCKWCTDMDHHYISNVNLEFWYQILREHSHYAFSTARNRHISVLRNVRYKKEFIDILKSVIDEHQVIHIVPPAGKSNKLTLWKIVQTLDKTSHFFMNDEVLKYHLREASNMWMASDIAVLITEGLCWDSQLIQFLKCNYRKKLVIVSSDCEQTKMIATHFSQTHTRFEDILNVDQFNECLYFQDRAFKLNGVPLYKALRTEKEIRVMAAQETFEELLNYGKLEAFYDEVGSVSYTVVRHHFIHKEVVFEKGYIFGIKGDVKQLRCLKPFQKKNFERSTSKTLPCKEVKNRKDFMTLCEKYNNVHWLQLKNNQLIWLESKGSMKVITKYIVSNAPTYYSIDKDYCFKNEPPGRIVLMVDDCDAGLLDCIIKCTKKSIPKYFILLLKLLDYVPLLEKPNTTFEELMDRSTNTQLHKALFKFALEKTERAEVFLNACGKQLEPVHHKKMVEFVNKLLQNTMVRKVWITADGNCKEMLEASFSTLAFTRVEGVPEKLKPLNITDVATENDPEMNQDVGGNRHLVEVNYSERICRASLLHAACQAGDLNQVKHLVLQQNADINDTDNIFLQTPLMWAARSGKEEIIDFLIQKGAKTALYDKQGASAIHLAALSGNIGAVRSLMCAADMDINTVDDLKRTPLMWAVRNSHLNMVKYLIKNGARPLQKDEHNYNLLLLAVESGNLPVIEFLLHRKETQAFINSSNSKKETPLILAVQNNIIIVAIMLLKRGAKVELQDSCGQTPLHVALRQKNTTMFKVLLKWCSDYCLEKADRQGKTILHLAAKHGNIEAFNCLEKYHCDESICNIPSKVWRNSALHYAAKEGHLEITKWLIEHGSKVNASDRKRNTPLHWACLNGHSEIVQILLDNGANINQCNMKLQTPAHIAAMKDHADIVHKLWLYNADMNATDKKNQTPFLRAQQNKCTNVLSLLK